MKTLQRAATTIPNESASLVAAKSPKPRVRDWSEKYGLLILFAIMFGFFGIYGKTGSVFLSRANLLSLLGGQMVVLVVALAVMLPLTAHFFDLSTGAICGVTSIVCATMMSRFHDPVVIAIAAAIIVGALLGTINGVLIAKFGLSSVIATLAMSTALSGAMVWYTQGNEISSNISNGLTNFGSLNLLGVPRLLYAVVPLAAIEWYMLEHTPMGRYIRAIASNTRSAQLVGIKVKNIGVTVFISSGALAGVAGVLLTANSGGANATSGPSFLFPALAAVFLGATVIKPGRPNVVGTIVGVFFVAFSVSGLSLMGASSWVSDLFNGVVLFAAASISTIFARQRGGTRIF